MGEGAACGVVRMRSSAGATRRRRWATELATGGVMTDTRRLGSRPAQVASTEDLERREAWAGGMTAMWGMMVLATSEGEGEECGELAVESRARR